MSDGMDITFVRGSVPGGERERRGGAVPLKQEIDFNFQLRLSLNILTMTTSILYIILYMPAAVYTCMLLLLLCILFSQSNQIQYYSI